MADYDINLTFGYNNTDLKRIYTFGVDSVDGSALVTKVKAINASLSGGTDDGLNTFFRAANNATFSGITAVQSIHNTETNINLSQEEEGE